MISSSARDLLPVRGTDDGLKNVEEKVAAPRVDMPNCFNAVGRANRIAACKRDLSALRKSFRESRAPSGGVVLVTCDKPAIASVAMAAVAEEVIASGTVADFPIHQVDTLTYLHSVDSTEAGAVRSFLKNHIAAGKLVTKPVEYCRHFDPLCSEGAYVVTQHLRPMGCILMSVAYADLKRDVANVALCLLNEKAKETRSTVVIMLHHGIRHAVTWLSAWCTAHVEVGNCEPGPGASTAILLENLTLAGWHYRGIGRYMVEELVGRNGECVLIRSPFIAKSVAIRLAWYILWENGGVSLNSVGDIVGVNKSNVSRGLRALLILPRNSVGAMPPPKWLTRWKRITDLTCIWVPHPARIK